MNNFFSKFGQPDIKIAGLTIWIHNRESPVEENWLNVTIHCGAEGAAVTTSGSIIHLSEIAYLLDGIEKIQMSLTGIAELPCVEPNLHIKIKAEKLGHIEMSVNITPDHLHQTHNFLFEIDQSYLPKLISNCRAVLEKYPIIGKR